ncbi:hypothetical protein Aperf_G00000027181 [Anoplocephala perfoliata]
MILRARLLSVILFLSLLRAVLSYDSANCPAVQSIWQSYVGNRAIPNQKFDESVCGNIHASDSCCTPEMLMGMSEACEHEIRRILSNILETTAENFRNDTIVLKTFVIDTLGATMEKLHSQLRRDFKYKFQPHERFFINFFTTIQSYLSGNLDDLPHLISTFFEELLLRVTQILLNTNSTDAYTICVVDALRPKQPFHRIPSIITNMTMEAFPPIRVAINSMAFARETLLAASITIQPSQECLEEYQRLRFCSLCAGVTTANMCESTCYRLAEICTPQQLALGPVWKIFITSLEYTTRARIDNVLQIELATRQEELGPFKWKSRFSYHHEIDAEITKPLVERSRLTVEIGSEAFNWSIEVIKETSIFLVLNSRILPNCSTASPSQDVSNADGGNVDGRWSYNSNLRRYRRQLQSPSSNYYRPLPNAYQQSVPPSSDSRLHTFETRPLPAVSLGEQGIAILQSWARDTKQRRNAVIYCCCAVDTADDDGDAEAAAAISAARNLMSQWERLLSKKRV